jgi:hypothetical protein
MKSPSDTQNTSESTFTNLTTSSNSILQAALSSSKVVDTSLVLPPNTKTNTSSPESEAVRRERLRVILDFAIAVIDSDDPDLIEPCTALQWPQQ